MSSVSYVLWEFLKLCQFLSHAPLLLCIIHQRPAAIRKLGWSVRFPLKSLAFCQLNLVSLENRCDKCRRYCSVFFMPFKTWGIGEGLIRGGKLTICLPTLKKIKKVLRAPWHLPSLSMEAAALTNGWLAQQHLSLWPVLSVGTAWHQAAWSSWGISSCNHGGVSHTERPLCHSRAVGCQAAEPSLRHAASFSTTVCLVLVWPWSFRAQEVLQQPLQSSSSTHPMLEAQRITQRLLNTPRPLHHSRKHTRPLCLSFSCSVSLFLPIIISHPSPRCSLLYAPPARLALLSVSHSWVGEEEVEEPGAFHLEQSARELENERALN